MQFNISENFSDMYVYLSTNQTENRREFIEYCT